MNWFAILPLILQYGPSTVAAIEQAWALTTSNEDFVTKIEKELPQLASLANTIAKVFFPNSAPAVATIVVTALTVNKKLITYAQQVANLLLPAGTKLVKTVTPLRVDGIYGTETEAAIKLVQTQLGLRVDGIFGKLSEAAVKKLNLPGLVAP